ncbi:MAG: hypothetical protein WC998_05995 [Candidatus Paceibacterota bacterium]|jgi:hypothetical protein
MANKSGYNASLTVGGYTGASLTNVSVSISGETVDVTDLADAWRNRARGPLDWEVTGTKNVDTVDFLTLVATGSTAMPSLGVTVKNMTGSTIFSGIGFPTRASATLPMGAATEEITIQGMTYPSTP